MKYSARLQNMPGSHHVTLSVGNREQSLPIAAKESSGASVTGGELLFLALATCYCNDIYREAAKLGIKVRSVEVEVEGDFAGPGLPASDILYRAKVDADASPERIRQLLLHTDSVAEIHNTVRLGTPVRLEMPDSL
jgi:uncharacterized OsmC-like protein